MNRKQRRAAARGGASGSPPPAIPAAMAEFHQAQALHQAGRFDEAEALYRRLLETNPKNEMALHFMGVAAYQRGDLATAEKLIGQAITVKPDYADAYNNLSATLRDQGRQAEAIHALRRAIELKPDMASAHNNLGKNLYDLGRPLEAEAATRRAVDLDPTNAEAYFDLGNALIAQEKYQEAEGSYRKALELLPGAALGHNNLGTALLEQDKMEEAEANYRRALVLQPDFAEAHYNLGNVLRLQDLFKDAIASYRQAIALNPGLSQAHANLSLALQKVGMLIEAEASCRQAIGLKPDYFEAHNNLGSLLKELGKISEAITTFGKALTLKPDYAEAHYNLGNLYKAEGKISDAIACYEHAIKFKPDYAEAHNNLAGSLKNRGDLDAALATMRHALKIQPGNAVIHSGLIFLLDFDPSQDQQGHQAERRRWAEAHARPLAARIRPHRNDPDPERRLRIGYVSADFYNHSAVNAFGAVVMGHDPAAFEVTCYSSVKKGDETTERFRAGVSHWRDMRYLSDADLAQQVRSDGIDILVDLSGHTEGNRLLAFAEKPAPVLITAWGHGTGTGLETMDYLIADPVMIPVSERDLFAEEIFDLPSNFLYEPASNFPPVTALPAMASGHITFGCLNRREKISAQSIGLWSEILNDVPGSRLLIKTRELSDDAVCAGLVKELVTHGIAEDRLVMIGQTNRGEHLKAHGQIDIALDPFPQGGGISTADALWMGVPVVTLRGRTVSSRNAASILTVVGLDEFIAETPDSYRDIAIAAAGDIARLGDIRSGLRRKAERSPLGDIKAYVRSVEAAYHQMWRRWCTTAQPITDVAE